MSSKAKRAIVIILIVMVLAALVGLALTGKPILWQPQPPPRPEPNQPVHPTARLLPGQVQAPERLTLKAPAAGKIVALGTGELQPVTAGQLLVQVKSASAEQQLAAARKRLQQVQAQVAAAKTGPLREQLRQARLRRDGMIAELTRAREALEQYRTQQPKVAALAEGLRAATERTTKAQAALHKQTARLDALQRAGTDPQSQALLRTRAQVDRCYSEAVAAARGYDDTRLAAERQREDLAKLRRLEKTLARATERTHRAGAELARVRQTPLGQAAVKATVLLDAAQADVTAAERLVAACAVKATFSGRVSELPARPGASVQAGQTLAVVEQGGGDRLVCQAAPADLPGLKVGQHLDVRPSGGNAFKAAISQLVPGPEAVRVYLVPLGRIPLPARGTTVVAQLLGGR